MTIRVGGNYPDSISKFVNVLVCSIYHIGVGFITTGCTSSKKTIKLFLSLNIEKLMHFCIRFYAYAESEL